MNSLSRLSLWISLAFSVSLWLGYAVAAVPKVNDGLVRFDFETGDMQGWTVVEGSFLKPIGDLVNYHNEPTVTYNHQGKYYLNTLEGPNYTFGDSQTGVVESPVFKLSGGTISFLIGGGSHPDTYVALCLLDGTEIMKASGADSEHMRRVTWDAQPVVGKLVVMRIVDHNRGGWGHVTFDDFQANGVIDATATREQRKLHLVRIRQERLHTINKKAAALRNAVADLRSTFGSRYPGAQTYLTQLDEIVKAASTDDISTASVMERFDSLQCKALLNNPFVNSAPILFVTRAQYLPDHHNTATMFQNGEINTGSFRGGGTLKSLDLKTGKIRTLISLPKGIVRDPELSFDGRRIIVSMRRTIADDYHIYELNTNGTGLHQITFGTRLSDIDPAYLPDGRIVFSSTRDPKVCQCNRHVQANLFVMDRDGSNMVQIGRNTLFEGHPSMMPDGRILYDRWEYVDKQFGPAFGLWTVNPDGTNQATFYHNNAWTPGAILDARNIPGTNKFIATYGSCHDRPWGAIAIVDPAKGHEGTYPIQCMFPADAMRLMTNIREYGDGRGGHPCAGQIDNFRSVGTYYENPYPLSEKYFLCSRSIGGEKMAIFLCDTFGNEVLVHSEDPGCYDPMPILPRSKPAVIPARTNLAINEGRFYVADVYRGDGMESVKRGEVKSIRIVEAPEKLFWSNAAWGIDATQAPAMNWNCTNNKRILGTVPVEPDGSAYFTAPAGRFLYFQLLDADGMMIQTMRSGTTLQPGETTGCIGCHDNRSTTVPSSIKLMAMSRPVRRPVDWHGPPRDFNYLTEVQPIFDRKCVSCHDYGKPAGAMLNLAGDPGLVFNASYVELRTKSALRWFPDKPGAEKLLVKVVDDGPAEILPAGAWGSRRSKLVDALRSDHHGVHLTREDFDRIVTWIDLNAPYYGSYATATPDNAFGRSPLTNEELGRLAELTGLPVGSQDLELRASQVSFARPELSPCLEGLKRRDANKFNEAVAIISRGTKRLASQPREDMAGFVLVGQDCDKELKYDIFTAEQARVRSMLANRRNK